MANSLNTYPIKLDTDITSYRTAANATEGLRILKLVLAVGPSAASTTGVVTITSPSDGTTLFPPMAVSAAQAAYTILYNEDPNDSRTTLTWRDFAVTGLTATGTNLYIWGIV